MKLIIIGFRGAGKTTIAKLLSEKLFLPRFSIDDAIVERTGNSIMDLVAKHGWSYFREVETIVLTSMLQFNDCVIDCGGGIVDSEQNVSLIKNEFIIFINARPDDLLKRIINDKSRPLLNQSLSIEKDIYETYNRRAPIFNKLKTIEVNTSNQTPEECIDQINEYLKKSGLFN